MTQKTAIHRPPEALFTPVTDRWTAPFWDYAAQRVLVVPQCGSCGCLRMPPTPFCPACLSQEVTWKPLTGRGTIFSHSAVMRAVVPAMAGAIPYVVAVIEPDDAPGCRLISNIVESWLEDVAIGAPVEILFDQRTDGFVVPRFKLSRGQL